MASRDRADSCARFRPGAAGSSSGGWIPKLCPPCAPPGSGSPAGGRVTVPPSRVSGQVLEQVCPGGLELLAVHSQAEEPAPEGVRRVVGLRAGRAGARHRQGLVGNRKAKLDVGLDLARVEGRVESPELDGALLEHTVQVQQVVAAGVVVLVCMPFPVPVVVPNPGELLGGGWLPAVQGREEVRVDGLAPPPAPFRADLEGLGQEVFLGVHQVHQVPQGFRGVAPQPDVYVDAAGGVGVCASRPEGPDTGLHRFDVFPAANRADELGAVCARPGDAHVRDQLPLTYTRRTRKKVLKTRFFRRWAHRPIPLSDFALVKCPPGTLSRFALRKSTCSTLLRFALAKFTDPLDFRILLCESPPDW